MSKGSQQGKKLLNAQTQMGPVIHSICKMCPFLTKNMADPGADVSQAPSEDIAPAPSPALDSKDCPSTGLN